MNIDKTIFLFLNGFTGRYFFLDFSFYFLAEILPFIMMFPFFFLILRNWRKNGLFVGEVLFAGLFAKVFIVDIIRHLVPKLRPFLALKDANLLLSSKATSSFPSGHTSFFFAVSTVVYLYNKKWGYLFYSLSFLMALCRVFSGVHWLSDIFGGILVGAFSGIVANIIFSIVKKRFLKNKK